MPVLTKEKHKILEKALENRIHNLTYLFEKRNLVNSSEGIKGRGSWVHPEDQCATMGNKEELSLAIADFKAILAEISKLN